MIPLIPKLRDVPLIKGGPYIGPKGGKWADAAHTIPWREDKQLQLNFNKKDSEEDPEKTLESARAALKQLKSLAEDVAERHKVTRTGSYGDQFEHKPEVSLESGDVVVYVKINAVQKNAQAKEMLGNFWKDFVGEAKKKFGDSLIVNGRNVVTKLRRGAPVHVHGFRHMGVFSKEGLSRRFSVKLTKKEAEYARTKILLGSGSPLTGKWNGAGPTKYQQTMPEYGAVYGTDDASWSAADAQVRAAELRRRASHAQAVHRLGVHGETPEPSLKYEPKAWHIVGESQDKPEKAVKELRVQRVHRLRKK